MRRSAAIWFVGVVGLSSVFAIGGQTATTSDPAPVSVDLATTPPASWWGGASERPTLRLTGPLSDELVESCLAVAAEVDPTLAERLVAMCGNDPDRFRRVLAQSRRLLTLGELRLRDATAYDLKLNELLVDLKIERLAADWRGTEDGPAAEEIENQLRFLVIMQLGFRHNYRQQYLDQLKRRVEELSRELEHELLHFDDALDARMAELRCDPAESPPR